MAPRGLNKVFVQLTDVAEVLRPRCFTRFSQRLYGWGDSQATPEDVKKAVRDGDYMVFMDMMPKAKHQLQQLTDSELQHLPDVFQSMQNMT